MTMARAVVDDAQAAMNTKTTSAMSDHLFVSTSMQLRPLLRPHERPIPSWITKPPTYRNLCRRELAKLPTTGITPNDRWRRTKNVLRTSAARARDAWTARHTRIANARLVCALQAIRADSAGGDGALATVARRWPPIRRAVGVVGGHGQVCDRDAFHYVMGRVIRDSMQATTRGTPTTPDKGSGIRALHNARPSTKLWTQLFAPRTNAGYGSPESPHSSRVTSSPPKFRNAPTPKL